MLSFQEKRKNQRNAGCLRPVDMLLEFRRIRKLYMGSSDYFLSPLARSKSQMIKKLKTVTASRRSHKGNRTPNVEYYI